MDTKYVDVQDLINWQGQLVCDALLCYCLDHSFFAFFSFVAPGVGGIQLDLISIAQAIKHLIQK